MNLVLFPRSKYTFCAQVRISEDKEDMADIIISYKLSISILNRSTELAVLF